MDATPRLDELLAHAGWARRLALRLVADPQAADDLVQDAWIVAATRGWEGDEPRTWLARALRRLAIRRHRSEGARRVREATTARPEAQEPVDEVLARAQLEHALAAAVLALEEPYRRTVLLRYFDGLSAEEIARREDAPASTVRNRLARALEGLRAHLDREQGGREEWMSALVGAFLPEPAAASASTASIGAVKLALAGALLVTVVAWSLGSWPFAPGANARAERVASAGWEHVDPSTSPLTAPGRGAARELASSDRESSGAPAGHAVIAAAATLRGRMLLPDGAPASGVELTLSGRARYTDVIDSWPDPIVWETQHATSDADGRFELHFVPPPPYQFDLAFHEPGFARRTFEWDVIEPASEVDLGNVRLELGATLRVRVRDAAGHDLVDGWSASAMFAGGRSDGIDTAWGASEHEPTPHGWLVVPDLLAGSWNVSAHHACGLGTSDLEVHVDAGAVEDVVLPYTGPDPARSILLAIQMPYYVRPNLDAAHVRARASNGVVHAPDASDPHSYSRLRFTDLAPDTYTIEIDDPAVQPWTSAPTAPGPRLRVPLLGTCTVALNVVDVRTQTAVTECILRLDTEHSTPRAVRTLRDTGPVAPLAGLLPGRYSLSVETRDLPRIDVPEFELAPGETRTLTIEVGTGRTIAGRVVEDDGTSPVPRATVRLFHRAEVDDSATSPWCIEENKIFSSQLPKWRKVARTTIADDAGRFRFEAVPIERFVVRADADGGGFGVRDDVAAEVSVEDLEVQLAPRCAIEGRLLAPEGAEVDGLSIEAWPVGQRRASLPRTQFLGPEHVLMLRPDATFRFDTLPPGSFRLWLSAGELRVTRHDGRMSFPGEARELGLVEVHAGAPSNVEYDLRPSFPAPIVAHVTIDGEIMPGLNVVAVESGVETGKPRSVGMVKSDGVARMTALPPGTWTLYVRNPNAPWNHRVPRDVTLQSGRRAEVTIAITSVESTMTCVDEATGEPWVREDISIGWRIGDFSEAKYVPTDEHGRITMRMLPGRYTFRRAATTERLGEVEFEWTTQGPATDVVRLR
ncbi:MAG: sigma-70 family RNA polymerase sigma factor [Planctomycetes bacterium]|nr:sigma-70 family RNA polymerase sigma factor [Planctomycetota bacterium]